MRKPVTVAELVERFGMSPHPEGGYYKETYRAPGLVRKEALPPGFAGDRSFSTAILYLLPEGGRSKMHRLKADELFHFYLGGPMTLVQITPRGELRKVLLGHDLAAGCSVQYVVEAGSWFGGYCNPGSPFSLIGCTVAPGFDFADFEMADRAELIRRYPQAAAEIEKLMG